MGGGPADKLLCVLPFSEPTEILENLRKKHPNVDIEYISVRMGRTPRDVTPIPKDVFRDKTILVTLSNFPPTPADAPNLELIQLFSAGANHVLDLPIIKNTDITLTTMNGIHGPNIAEWCVMTALVHSHKYNQLHELQKEHKWGKTGSEGNDYRTVRDFVQQRVGILGYGSIGRQVGRVAKAMGMDVVAFTATPKDTPEKKKDNGFIVPGTGDPDGEYPSAWYSGLDKESLHHFLKQDLDWIVVAVPLTDDTRHMLSTSEFDILSKRKTFVTNIARGPIIDQPALVTALKDGKLRGAALDVTDPEPLPPDDPLWSAPNAIVTPHISGVGLAYTERALQLVDLQLKRREKGERLINVVKRDRGY